MSRQLHTKSWLLGVCVGFYACTGLAALKTFDPEDVLQPEEIKSITENKSYFARVNTSWNRWERKHVDPILRRTKFLTYDDVLRETLKNSFDLSLNEETIYRTNMDKHIAIGALLPHFTMSFGDGVQPLNLVSQAFSNLFGFLLPQNWLNVAMQKKLQEAARLAFVKQALDAYLTIRSDFYAAQQRLIDMETMLFYQTHLRLLARHWEDDADAQALIEGLARVLQSRYTDFIMAPLNTVFQDMTMTKDLDGRLAADRTTIKNLDPIPDSLVDIEDLGAPYFDKENFVQKALELSVEVQIARILYSVSKLSITISALSPNFNKRDSGTQPQFGVSFGWGSIPTLLKARSLKRSAKVAINQASIFTIDKARRAHGDYIAAVRLLRESEKSLEVNRRGFLAALQRALQPGYKPDMILVQLFQQLLESEFNVNRALTNGLRFKATMQRYVLDDPDGLLERYMPAALQVKKSIDFFKKTLDQHAFSNGHLDMILQTVHRSSDLKPILEGNILNEEGEATNIAVASVIDAMQRNMPYLLDGTIRKSRKFYQMLRQFLQQENVTLDDDDNKLLNAYANHTRVGRLFMGPGLAEDEDIAEEAKEKSSPKENRDETLPNHHIEHGTYKLGESSYFSLARKRL